MLTCTPKTQLCLLAASITVANIWHVLTPFYAICGWIGSPRGLLLLVLCNAVASSPLSSLCISTSWHQVQKFIVPLSTLVAVTKRSYRGDAIPAAWNAGYRRYVRLTVPWIVRCIVLMLLIWLKTKHASSTTTEHECLDELPSSPPPLHFDHCETRTGDTELKDSSPRRKCTDFYGKPLPCSALDRARLFNMFAMPSLKHKSYREVRRRMSSAGLEGTYWHVGHAVPDPDKTTFGDSEGFGWILFCQGASDNRRLGHRLVTCSEATHWGAHHVNCTR